MRVLLVLLVLLAGCSGPMPGTGVILLADWRPGLAMMVEMYDPPDFVLYSDGRAIAREERDSGVLKLVEYHLTPQRIEDLFSTAAFSSLFLDADYSLDRQVPDGGGLVLLLRTTEREQLIDMHFPSPDDFGARGAAARFAETLRPSQWPSSAFTRPPAPYRPGRVALTISPFEPTSSSEPLQAWPLPDPKPGCAVVTGAAAAQLEELGARSRRTTLWRSGTATFHAWIRPLLPDESDCRATERRYIR
jgi:hypothetical protein